MEFYIIKKLLFILLILIPFLTTIITFCENPIYALLSFNILLLNFIIILHTLGIQFLSLLLFLIYFGGILILFIFAILLLNLRNFKPIF
jgi:NADH:ubiquinone oxidoreductase subunit 6 (subunit J)